MRRVLAIGWDRKTLLDIVSECENVSIRLVCIGQSYSISSDIEGHFELILINGIASISTYRKIAPLLDCDSSTSYLFESETTPADILKQFVQDNFLWRGSDISTNKIQQCLANRDKVEWKRSQDESSHQNFKAYLKLFHKTVSHEFYTPVNIIKTSMHLLENYQDKLSHADRQEQLSFIKEGATRLERLINDIRLYSEFTNSQNDRLLTPINLDELIASTCSSMEDSNPLARGRLHFTPAKNDLALSLDTRLIAEALKRIVQNALENSTDTVRIVSEPQVDHLAISIHDTGHGIADTDIDSIFTPYSRGGDIDSKQGLGLGLPIAKHCIETHGGQLNVQSTLGHGSTFTIQLPFEIESRGQKFTDA